jgi:putative YphP/YqiW family bacilliredoxin
MRQDLVRIGFTEMRTAADVDRLLGSEGTVLVAVNSVCGCSAGAFRPAIALALESPARPRLLTTVFAGQDMEATARAREYFVGYPSSSPSLALLQGGNLVYMLERRQIEGRTPREIAADLQAAFAAHCR